MIRTLNHIDQDVFHFVDVSLTGGKHGRISPYLSFTIDKNTLRVQIRR